MLKKASRNAVMIHEHPRGQLKSHRRLPFSKHNPWRLFAVLWLVFRVEVWWHLIISSLFSDQSGFCDLGHSSDPARFSDLDHTVFLEYVSRKKIVSDQSLNVYLHCQQGEIQPFSLQAHQHQIFSALLLSALASVRLRKNRGIHLGLNLALCPD
jgi:hypothetical protein